MLNVLADRGAVNAAEVRNPRKFPQCGATTEVPLHSCQHDPLPPELTCYKCNKCDETVIEIERRPLADN